MLSLIVSHHAPYEVSKYSHKQLPAALLSVCVTGSPVARHQRRAVGEVFDGPPSNTTGTNSTCYGIGIDGYNLYTGDGSPTDGWPTIGQWATYDYLYVLC